MQGDAEAQDATREPTVARTTCHTRRTACLASTMQARTLLYSCALLLLSPAASLASLGVHSRTRSLANKPTYYVTLDPSKSGFKRSEQ
jgi:hypothetical protein